MTRILGVNVLPEMLALWLIETSVCFLAFFALLHGAPDLPSEDGVLANLHTFATVNAVLLALTVGLVGVATGLYRPETCVEARWLLLKAAVSAAVSLPAVWLVAKAINVDVPMPDGGWAGWPLKMLIAWASLLFVTRVLYRTALRMNLFVRRVAVLGPPQAVARTVEAINGMRRFWYRVEAIQVAPRPPAGLAPPNAHLSNAHLPNGLWGVVVAGHGVTVDVPTRVRRFDAEAFWEDQLGRIDLASADRHYDADMPQAAPKSRMAAIIRRLLDIVLSSLLLLLTAPVLLITALLIRIESPGPVIYRQERVGLGGRTFTLWKFRSMRNDAERFGPSWAALRDARVTAVGGLIRKVRIDELPQLVNILRGEMSLVGPRPERPHFVEQLARAIPTYRQRVLVKPGLTGWAQVSYPYGASVEDARAKLSYDLYYVKYRSLLFDLLILLSTVRVILFQEGAR